MTRIYWADVNPLWDDTIFEASLAGLPECRQSKVCRLKYRRDKNLCIGAWLVFAKTLKDFPGYNGTETILIEKNGKPYFKDNPDVHFSLSHSGSVAICAVSDNPTGIDIQEICDFKEEICRRYFSKKEADYVLKNQDDINNKKDRFFRIWTLKEAYAKMTGKGLGGFRNFEIVPVKPAKVVPDGSCVSFAEFDIPGYKAAVCHMGKDADIDFRKINLFK